MTVSGLFSRQQILVLARSPLSSLISATQLWLEPEADQPAHPSPPGGDVSYSAGWGEEEENNQECWKENNSWKQLQIIPHQNNYSVLFVLDHLHENASHETVISAETEESRLTPAAWLKAN